MVPSQNLYLVGTNGYVWMNGKLLGNVSKIEAKKTGEFQDVRTCGSFATQNVYTGYSGEGTLTLNKIDSAVLLMMEEAYESGNIPDIKIISKLENKSTKKAERVALTEVVFTEYTLISFESSGTIVEEIPYKFSRSEILESIA